MSIANEVQRIILAKNELKAELVKRGADVENAAIDKYASKLKELVCCVKGECTPEEDKADFEISGLTFKPEMVIAYNREIYNLNINGSIGMLIMSRDVAGMVRVKNMAGELKVNALSVNSPYVSWSDTGCAFVVPSPEINGYFKAGYTLEYYVLGRTQ